MFLSSQEELRNRLTRIREEEEALQKLESKIQPQLLHQQPHRDFISSGPQFAKVTVTDRIISVLVVIVSILILRYTSYIKIVRDDANIYPFVAFTLLLQQFFYPTYSLIYIEHG